MQPSCAGGALGLFIWFGLVLGLVQTATRNYGYVTLPPLCTDDSPLLQIGLFSTTYDPTCLNNSMPEGYERTSNFDFLSETYSRSLISTVLLPDPRTMNYATFNALSLILLKSMAGKATDSTAQEACEDAWLSAKGEELGLKYGDLSYSWWSTYDSVDSLLDTNLSSSYESLIEQTDAFYDHTMLFLWTLVMQETVTNSVTPLVAMLADSSKSSSTSTSSSTSHQSGRILGGGGADEFSSSSQPDSSSVSATSGDDDDDVVYNLAYYATKAVQLIDSGESEVCDGDSDCEKHFEELEELAEGLYLDNFVSALCSAFDIDSTASSAPAEISTSSEDIVTMAIYSNSLNSISSYGSTSGPLAVLFYNSSKDHPLCLAFDKIDMLVTGPSSSKLSGACILSLVGHTAIRNNTSLGSTVSSLLSTLSSEVVSLGKTAPSCSEESSVSAEYLETGRNLAAPNSSVSDMLNAYNSHLCGSRSFLTSHEAGSSFILGEECTSSDTLTTCRKSFFNKSSTTSWPGHFDNAFSLCKNAAPNSIAEALDSPTKKISDLSYWSERTWLQDLWSKCTLTYYLDLRDKSSAASVLERYFWTPCKDSDIYTTADCLNLRQSLDLASTFYGSILSDEDALVNTCGSNSRTHFTVDTYINMGIFFLPLALSVSFLTCVIILDVLLRGSCVSLILAPCLGFFSFGFYVGLLVCINMSNMQRAILKRKNLAESRASVKNATSLEVMYDYYDGCTEGQLCFYRGYDHVILRCAIAGTCLGFFLLLLALICSKQNSLGRIDEHAKRQAASMYYQFSYASDHLNASVEQQPLQEERSESSLSTSSSGDGNNAATTSFRHALTHNQASNAELAVRESELTRTDATSLRAISTHNTSDSSTSNASSHIPSTHTLGIV